jgi:hypothetical protein
MSMFKIGLVLVLTLASSYVSHAQSVLRVPGVQAVSGSNTHLYVLSSTEGLAVFRASGDSLIWLYNSDALLRRGTELRSDARFAYLFGNDTRLTVIDPTVSQALYSAAMLQSEPRGVARVGTRLFLAMGGAGVASISLADPAGMESTFEAVQARFGPGEAAIDIVSHANRIFVLGSTGTIYPFIVAAGTATQEAPVATGFNARRIFESNGSMLLTTDIGNAIQWNRTSFPVEIATIGSAVTDAHLTGAGWIVRTEDARLWKIDASAENKVSILRDNSSAGNHLTINKGNIWVSEFGRISTLSEASIPLAIDGEDAPSNRIRISKVSDMNIPFPQPLLVSFTLEEGSSQGISWYVRHSSGAVPVRGNALMWQPKSSDTGTNTFYVTATNSLGASDSLTFNVEVRQFNSPPRLTPTRPVSIPADEEFTLQLVGIDPDGTDTDLVRYTGVNLPEGIRLDPQTGLLRWTPTDRQLGRHVLQIVTSDQFGASMSNEVILNVIRMRR